MFPPLTCTGHLGARHRHPDVTHTQTWLEERTPGPAATSDRPATIHWHSTDGRQTLGPTCHPRTDIQTPGRKHSALHHWHNAFPPAGLWTDERLSVGEGCHAGCAQSWKQVAAMMQTPAPTCQLESLSDLELKVTEANATMAVPSHSRHSWRGNPLGGGPYKGRSVGRDMKHT